MKKVLFLAFAALFFGIAAHAQTADGGNGGGRRGPGGGMRQNSERMAQELNLTDDQKAQFDAIDKAQSATMDSLRQSGASRDDMRQTMMANRKAANDKKRALLTSDQQTKFDQILQEQEERMKNFQQQRGGGNGNGGGGN